MKLIRALLLAAVGLTSLTTPARTADNFDGGWRFLKSDAAGAEQRNFDDSTWRQLDLPHDWSIEGPFAATNKTGGAGAFLPSGTGWYRKHFTLPPDFPNARYAIEFDGVMQNSDVWINGFHVGHRPNGYASFSYDLTGHLNFGKTENVIAVRCDTAEQPASRWYSGAGIYRHVRLVQTTPIYIPQNGIFISTAEASGDQARVHAEISVTNVNSAPLEIFLNLAILDPAGKTVAAAQTPMQTVSNFCIGQFEQDFTVKNPQLWDLAHPNLYQMRVEVCGPPAKPDSEAQKTAATAPAKNTSTNDLYPRPWGSLFDSNRASFGIRDAHFEADTGFWLNGKNLKIYGVCLHHDGGAFGAAVPLTIWEARLKTLKSLGVNAIRTAHNPPAPEFLDLCDRMGLLVMDEFFDCWTVGKNPYDYHLQFNTWSHTDERDAIRRDRNHPSVILYSVGNEIHDTPQAEKAKKILAGLVAVAHEADPTRPVTQALFRPNVSGDYDNGLADLLDVVGQNYREKEILAAHEQKPSRKIIGTENTHAREQWVALRDHPAYAGQFLWTGIDYLGEARHWPIIGHGSGLLDRTGLVRPLARERQSWWIETPMVAITRRISRTEDMPADPGYGAEEKHTQVLFADWTPKNLSPHDENVEVYSNEKEVELFLNGKSLGKKEIHADASPRNWAVPFAPGTLKAVATDNDGKTVATDELRTAGRPAKIVLSTETKTLSPGFDNVAIVRARITDANGIEIPRANDLIAFTVSGPGVIAAVDNGDNASHESFQAAQRQAFQGEGVAFVKATGAAGKISVKASAAGLKNGAITFKSTK